MTTKETMAELDEKIKAFAEAHKGKTSDEILAAMRGEEPVSEELQEAIEAHRKELDYWGMPCGYKDASCSGFKDGANWQKEQMMKDAKEGIVTDKGDFIKFMDGTWVDLDPTVGNTPAFSLKEGQKVKLIVIKED